MLLYYLFNFLLVMYITERIPFPSPEYQWNNVKKSAIQSLMIIIAEIIISVGYILIVYKFKRCITALEILFMQSAFYFLLTAIVIFAVKKRKESLQTIGITKINLIKACIFGVLLGIIFYVFKQVYTKTNSIVNIISIASLISFIEFIVVGFAEEIIYRGYLQTRLIAWLGTTKGCLITAIIFSFYHLPVNLVFKGLDLQTAFLACVNLIPLSLLLGYIMIKTKNIVTVSILHTFMDWTLH